MSTYQQIVVATQADVGSPGPLPAFLVGLSNATLANLTANLDPATMASPHLLPLAGMGFLPVADPAPDPRWISVYDFEQRFTAAEREGIEASTDKAVIDFLTVLRALPQDGASLFLDDPNTQNAVSYMGSTTPPLLATGRPAAILA